MADTLRNFSVIVTGPRSLMICPHWFRWWLCAVKQQAITRTNVDPYRSMSSYGVTKPQWVKLGSIKVERSAVCWFLFYGFFYGFLVSFLFTVAIVFLFHSNRGVERRWLQNKTGVVHRYQAIVVSMLLSGSFCHGDNALCQYGFTMLIHVVYIHIIWTVCIKFIRMQLCLHTYTPPLFWCKQL